MGQIDLSVNLGCGIFYIFPFPPTETRHGPDRADVGLSPICFGHQVGEGGGGVRHNPICIYVPLYRE